MKKEQLIKEIKHTALLRYEMYADKDQLKGRPRAAYLDRHMKPIVWDICSSDRDGLEKLLQHQQFMLKKTQKDMQSSRPSDSDKTVHRMKTDNPLLDAIIDCEIM